MINAAVIAALAVVLSALSLSRAAADVDLQALLGPEKRVRDSVSFTTEKGETAALVLYVTDVQAVGGEENDEIAPPVSCPQEVPGIPLAGVYHVALIVDGKLVNEITIPAPGGGADGPMALPLRNLPSLNYEHWGQGKPVEDDAEERKTEPTKILRLADYNGDGRAWEFRLVQSGAFCGHLATLVAGYSAKRRAVVIYPILSGPFRSEWSDNFFPHPTKGAGTKLETTFRCGDHGNEKEVWQEYLYGPEREAWVLRRHRERACEGMDKIAEKTPAPLASPITLAVGSAEGAPGEEVSIEVMVDTGDAAVDRIEHAIVVDPRVSVAFVGLDFERGSSDWDAADTGLGPIHCASELVETCEWAFQMRLDGKFHGRSILYALRLAIPNDAAPGFYPLRNVDVVAQNAKGERLALTGADGKLVVRPAEGR